MYFYSSRSIREVVLAGLLNRRHTVFVLMAVVVVLVCDFLHVLEALLAPEHCLSLRFALLSNRFCLFALSAT